MSTPNTTFFATPREARMGRALEPADERLHRAENAAVEGSAATETQYFSISIPEKGIRGVCYLWYHASLGVITGGVNVWRGTRPSALASELFDMRQYGDDEPFVGGDLDGFSLPNGYAVRVHEPFRSIEVTYDDVARGNRIDLRLTDFTPPAMAPSGHHFDQIMRATGTVTLRGETFEVDSFSVRDRSWGESRSEAPRPVPPAHYVAGAFEDDMAFIVQGFELPRADGPWAGTFPDFDTETAVAANGGWIWVAGELRALSSVDIRTEMDLATGYQTAHVLEMTDETGQTYSLEGTVDSVNQWSAWTNVTVPIGTVDWSWGERRGWGESQVVIWTDAAFALEQRRAAARG